MLDYERWIRAIFDLLKSERLAYLLEDMDDCAEPCAALPLETIFRSA